jgi:hypothetical protein
MARARLRVVEQLVPPGSWLVNAVDYEDGLSLFLFMRPIFYFSDFLVISVLTH